MAAQVVGPQAVQLANPCAVTLLPGFDDGDVSVQDSDSANFDGGQLVVNLVSGLTVTDVLGVRVATLSRADAPPMPTRRSVKAPAGASGATTSSSRRWWWA